MTTYPTRGRYVKENGLARSKYAFAQVVGISAQEGHETAGIIRLDFYNSFTFSRSDAILRVCLAGRRSCGGLILPQLRALDLVGYNHEYISVSLFEFITAVTQPPQLCAAVLSSIAVEKIQRYGPPLLSAM